MKYKCTVCRYKTDDASNWRKHQGTRRHNENVEKRAKLSKVDKKPIVCHKCGQSFAFASGLSRHKNKGRCKEGAKPDFSSKQDLDTLRDEFNKKIRSLEKKLKRQERKGTVQNISIKAYINQNFNQAPALAPITPEEYKLLEDKGVKQMIDKLIYKERHNNLHSYLGDHLIKYYKKKSDPASQAMWSSDTSRLTYHIRELYKHNKENLYVWRTDHKGVEVKNTIINPLLEMVKADVKDAIKTESMAYQKLAEKEDAVMGDHDYLTHPKTNCYNNRMSSLAKVQSAIAEKSLANEIARYIAPHFYLNMNQIMRELEDKYADDGTSDSNGDIVSDYDLISIEDTETESDDFSIDSDYEIEIEY